MTASENVNIALTVSVGGRKPSVSIDDPLSRNASRHGRTPSDQKAAV
jgi:hypothetical protein